MLTTLAIAIQHLIVSLGGFGVFLASLIEEIIVPIPSTLVQSGAGMVLLGGTAFSLIGFLKLILLVALPAALGVALGSLVIYAVVFYGGDYALRKYGKYFFIQYEKVETLRADLLQKKALLPAVTALRFIPLFPNVVITAACGLLKLPLPQYLISTALGIFVRALYLGAIGWATGKVSGAVGIDAFFAKIGSLIFVLAVISFFTTLVVTYVYKKKKRI